MGVVPEWLAFNFLQYASRLPLCDMLWIGPILAHWFHLINGFLNLSVNNQKNYITDKLKNSNWFKSNKRLEYNTWLYYKNNGFKLC
jgi:hypothetical protein